MTSKSEVSQDYMDTWRTISREKLVALNQKVFVTGATRQDNIGQEIIQYLKKGDHEVRTTDRDIRQLPPFETDDTALVMCHGINHMDWFEDQPLMKMLDQFDVNLSFSAVAAQAFVKATIKNDYRKTIIMIGSMAYRNVLNASAPYCASKAGLNMLARCLAWELAPKGYSVYIIHPSNVQDAPMSEDTIEGLMRYRKLSREDAEAYWGAVCPHPDGFLTKQEIAGLVKELIDGKFPYLAGCPIELGGGQR